LRKSTSGQGEGSAGGRATTSPSSEAIVQPGAADLKRLTPVVASMVGTFYASPTPGTPPYAGVGQLVKAGEVLCILEAMKLMNEVVSDLDGTVAAVLVEDGAAVEYGQPLFLIDVSGE
jgi:acetyl-CoA carboxylase biotin carboxyl carrier protein